MRKGIPIQLVNESKQSTFNSDIMNIDIQGELNRIQKSTKEILIPRWCVLNMKTFKYFKNQYSALCKEKPIFEIQIDKILHGKAYIRKRKLYIEFSYAKNDTTSNAQNSDIKCHSKYSTETNSKKNSMNSSFSSSNMPKINIPDSETLLFSVSDRSEWEKWSKSLLSCVKFNY